MHGPMSSEDRSSTFLLSCAPNAALVISRWFARYRFGSACLPAWTHSIEDNPRAARTESVLAGHRIQIAFFLKVRFVLYQISLLRKARSLLWLSKLPIRFRLPGYYKARIRCYAHNDKLSS